MRTIGVIITIGLIIINSLTVYKFLFNIIFLNRNDFNESVKYSLTPDIISLFRGQYWKDQMGELKLQIFFMLCIVITVVEYLVLNSLLQELISLWT